MARGIEPRLDIPPREEERMAKPRPRQGQEMLEQTTVAGRIRVSF
jgi:hypothetical protein